MYSVNFKGYMFLMIKHMFFLFTSFIKMLN